MDRKYKSLKSENKFNDPEFLSKVRKRFEDISYFTGREYKVDNPKEFDLDKWTLRDFVAEAHYEMVMRYDNIYDQNDRNEYNRYKRFVDTYSKYLTDDIKCYETHADAKYDLKEKLTLEDITVKMLIQESKNY